MYQYVCVIALCTVICGGQTETTPNQPPKFPETFAAQVQITLQSPSLVESGEWVHDFEEGHFKSEAAPNGGPQMMGKLQFFDKHIEYFYVELFGKVEECSKDIIPQDQKPPRTWEWVQHSYHSPYFDHSANISYSNAWKLDTDTGYNQVVLRSDNSTVPYLLFEVENNVTTKVEFITYQSATPAEGEFEIPDGCN